VVSGLVSRPEVADGSPLAIVRAFVAALERKDIDAAMVLVASNCEYDNVPMSTTFGPDAIRAGLAPFLAAATEVEWVTHRDAQTGPFVFNERTDRFQFAHGWVEIPVTGVWEVHEGLITLWRDYFDLATFTKQMPARG
jgi:limonene-1,2-epoxide hydrolase